MRRSRRLMLTAAVLPLAFAAPASAADDSPSLLISLYAYSVVPGADAERRINETVVYFANHAQCQKAKNALKAQYKALNKHLGASVIHGPATACHALAPSN